eukprot:TRINITY_DN3320_c0_g1_i1.p1 TRINITY_DN3320_c0_g1~~TRINITY_DN3320_c0_g1_i1.p1  ORF type:complete len:417 (-),score=67.88 TRINITY_DN3320_c0_g1_i1:81-1280(-)
MSPSSRARSRSPRRSKSCLKHQWQQHSSKSLISTKERTCAFCDKLALCEFGRDEDYCSCSCYTEAVKGVEALMWQRDEASSWMQQEGIGRWLRQLKSWSESGAALLTNLTEGVLRRAGVPRGKAKAVMLDVEDLRRGAWAQPEPPREMLPLSVVAETGRRVAPGWQLVLEDHRNRSYASLCKQAVSADVAWSWFQQLHNLLPWQDLSDERYQSEGKFIPRRTIFTVSQPGCRCLYKYSGVKVAPEVEPEFLAHIRRTCAELAGLKEPPNCCNINLYRDGMDSVGWHSDDEELFEGAYNDVCILSLSLGAARTFQIKPQQPRRAAAGECDDWQSARYGPATASVKVGHGDLCTMEGRFQRHYLHAVNKEPQVKEPRINLTWRWITKHNQADGCPLCGPGN